MISKWNSIIITALFLFIILGAMAYLDSFQAKNNAISTFQVDFPDSNADKSVANNGDDSTPQIPDLEEKLVDTSIIGGYLVETYQEFEVYKDRDGNVLKSVPTSHFDYLRYKQ